jgi:hypothetical protein
MEVADLSKIFVYFYRTARQNILEYMWLMFIIF